VAWHRHSGYTLIALKDAVQLTGLEPAELLRLSNTQSLTRVDESGAREECARIPVELLLEQPEKDA
jgi:hypothetical protein